MHPPTSAPAEKVVEYVDVKFRGGFGCDSSLYQGWPNDEQDERWNQLYYRK